MSKNKDFLPNNLFLKNYPKPIIYSLFRIKVSEQFSGHFARILLRSLSE